MTDLVVDSSVLAKWVLPEADSPLARRLASGAVAAGQQLIVLDIAIAEVANAIWKRLHRRLMKEPEAQELLQELLESPVRIEPSRRLLTSALEIAAKYDRTIYDSLFVAVSRDLMAIGVTADEPLHGVVHVDFPEIILLRDWRGTPSSSP